MKTAIVTGASGFIGCALVEELLQHDYQVYAVCRRASCDKVLQDKNVESVACDMREIHRLADFLPKKKYDVFFHLAWAGSAGVERINTELQLQNAQWTVDALRVSKALGCGRFVCAGSIMEREAIASAHLQGNRPGMGYIYGAGKLAARIMSTSIAAGLKEEIIWGVITNAYGPGEKSPRMVNTAIRKCIQRESLDFTAGTQNYDFVYIDDVARAFRLIAERGKPFCEYLIGSSQAKPLREFLLEMQAAIAPDIEFRFGEIPFTGADLPLSVFDCTNTERDTGFRAQISFAEGSRRTMEWLKAQGL